MIREYPKNKNSEEPLATKRDAPIRYGAFGVVVYTYHRSLEAKYAANINPRPSGKLYHPVDSEAEAEEWLEYYKGQEKYTDVWFLPTIEP